TTNYSAVLSGIRTEFWAVGLRNPYRFSFSPIDNTLYLGDVGEQNWEELDIITRGKNYGWNWFEGPLQRSNNIPSGPVPVGFDNPIPLDAYTQTNQADKYAIIAGYTYTGTRLSQLYGAFIYGDYGKGNIWAIRNTGTNVTAFDQLLVDDNVGGVAGISSFGVDPSNLDILYADLVSGTNSVIKRILYSTNAATGTPIPPTLYDTGAFADLAALTPASGVAPYDINVPFWSDTAIKSRWFSVPDTNLDITFNADANWSFPTGTVWIKHFELEITNGITASRKRLETRLLVKNDLGVYGVTYRWGTNTTNATLVGESGLDETFTIYDSGGGILRTQVWHYPSRSECLQCHTAQGGYALGFNTAQLNKNYSYASGTTNEIQAMSDAGYFSNTIPAIASLRALAHATNTAYSLEYRARSYLAANCRHCHQGAGPAFWDANIWTTTANAGLINGALINNFGDTNNRVIKAGSLTNSVLYHRISIMDQDHMPPLATVVLDTNNVGLIAAWITNGIPTSLTFQTPASLGNGYAVQLALLANFPFSTNDVTADVETSFSSSNPSVISISSSGLLTGLASSGSAQIIATFGAVSVTNTVTAVPAITIQTVSGGGTICTGSLATVSIGGSEVGNTYYLKLGSVTKDSLAGTGAALNFAGQATAGTYTVTATNGSGQGVAMSGSATITVNTPPVITNQPDSRSVSAGLFVSLSVVASGTSPSYFWYHDAVLVAGATNATLSFASVTTNDGGNYQVTVSNGCGTATSSNATLTVVPASNTGLFPAGPVITKSGLTVTLTNFATSPFSSRTLTVYPPVFATNGQLSRINFMRAEPTNVVARTSRFFVCDNNRNLYIVDKTNALSTNGWTKYISFEDVFPRFDNDPGYAGGLTTFAFDPEYATNGLFYTAHMESTGTALAPTNGAYPNFNTTGYTTTTEIDPPVANAVVRVAVLVEWHDTNVLNTTFEGTAREILRVGF
ncbi:MAG: hypothetical protein RLZZ350_2260, partial [Verrucomicrobiota bacterium]